MCLLFAPFHTTIFATPPFHRVHPPFHSPPRPSSLLAPLSLPRTPDRLASLPRPSAFPTHRLATTAPSASASTPAPAVPPALFTLLAFDKPGAKECRASTRPRHLEFVVAEEGAVKVRVAGPVMDGDGEVVGSLMVLEAKAMDVVEAWAKNDPYVTEGVFGSVDIRPWKEVMASRSPLPSQMYCIHAIDRPDAGDLRPKTRPDHLAWWEAAMKKGIIGPLLQNSDQFAPVGSFLLADGESLESVKAWAKTDPYARAGLFANVSVLSFRKVIENGTLVV